LSLDIAQPAQLSEKTLVEAEPYEVATGFADDGDGTCGDDDRNPALLPPLHPYPLRRWFGPKRPRPVGEKGEADHEQPAMGVPVSEC
jgi:hypothetical protein